MAGATGRLGGAIAERLLARQTARAGAAAHLDAVPLARTFGVPLASVEAWARQLVPA